MYDFRDYINFAEKQLMLAEDELNKSLDASWLLVSATILSWAAIECFVNHRLDDFGSLPDGLLELHEKAFLLEKRIRLEDKGEKIGRFILEGSQYNRLEDKIFFLIAKFGGQNTKKVSKGDTLWQEFEEFKNARDALVHPRYDKVIAINISKVKNFVETAKEVIQLVSENLWNKKCVF